MHRPVIVGTIVCLALVASYVVAHVERYEDSFIYSTKDRAYDPIGKAKVVLNILSRNCSAVMPVSDDSSEWHALKTALSNLQPYPSEAKLLRVMRSGEWFMVETEFADLEPAIVLVRSSDGRLTVQTDAEWSGNPGPWEAGPYIRNYLAKHAPEASWALLQCFEPTLEHFQ